MTPRTQSMNRNLQPIRALIYRPFGVSLTFREESIHALLGASLNIGLMDKQRITPAANCA